MFRRFGGIVERERIKAEADWYVTDYSVLLEAMKRFQVSRVRTY